MNRTKTKLLAAISIVAVFISLLSVVMAPAARADDLSAKEAELKKIISENQASVNAKRSEADTLQNKLTIIAGQISVAQQSLNLTKIQISLTEKDIEKKNEELDKQKAILKENLRQIYREGPISPLEVIASSKNLSDFVAKQQYLNAIKKKVDDNLEKIAKLKAELEEKRSNLNALSLQQKAEVDSIAAQQQEQQDLLAKTKGEEAAYQKIVNDSKQQLQGIYAERAARDAANGINVSTGGTGGYPWANGPRCSVEGCAHDGWTYFQRQCTSYAAWRWRQSGRSPNSGWGNAAQWKSHANSGPIANAIVVWDAWSEPGIGSTGHVAWVESVNANGTINVSEYNWRPESYSYRTGVPVHGGMYFIK